MNATNRGDAASVVDTTPISRGKGGEGLYAWYVVAVLLLVNALSYLDRQALSFLIVPMQRDLGITDTQSGLLLGPAFVVFYALAGLFLGAWADRKSRRNLLIAGIAVWSLATLLFGLAQDFTLLLTLRALIGLGEACVVPAAFSLVSDYFQAHRRGLATSIVTLGISFGVGAALFGGGMLLRWTEGYAGVSWPIIGKREAWQLSYIVFGLLGAVVIALLLTVREPVRGGLDIAPSPPEASFLVFLQRNAAAIALVLAAYFSLAFVLYSISSWLPTLLVRRHGMDAATAATTYGVAVLLCSPLGGVAGGLIGDWLATRYKMGRFMLAVVLSPVLLPGVLLITLPQTMPPVFAGICLVTLVAGVLSTSAFPAIQDMVSTSVRGRMLGLHGLLSNCVGVGLAPPAVAFVTQRVFGAPAKLNLAILTTAAPAVLVMVACSWLGARYYARMRHTYAL